MSARMEAENKHQFFCGFVDRGRKKLNLGQHSTIDTIIHGRDMDMSGEDPHRDWMRRYGTHAGLPSGQAVDNKSAHTRNCKMVGVAQASQMDEIIYGHDIDSSGADPHETYMNRFDQHAGKRSKESKNVPFRKQGMAQCSVMDNIIYGRDIDFSGDDPHVEFMNKFGTHAGKKCAQGDQKPFRKPGLAAASTMDEVIWGHDFDASGADPRAVFMQSYNDHAGHEVNKKHLIHGVLDFDNPSRQIGMAQVSSVEEVMYDRSEEEKHVSTQLKVNEHVDFINRFEGYAGSPASWKTLKKKPSTDGSPADVDQSPSPGGYTSTDVPSAPRLQPTAVDPRSDDTPAAAREAWPAQEVVEGELVPRLRSEDADPSPKLDLFEQTVRPKLLEFNSQAASPSPSNSKRVNPFGNTDRTPPTRSPAGSRGSSLCGGNSSTLESLPRWRS